MTATENPGKPDTVRPFLAKPVLFAIDVPTYVKEPHLRQMLARLVVYGPIGFTGVKRPSAPVGRRNWQVSFATIEQAEMAFAICNEQIIPVGENQKPASLQLSPSLEPFHLPPQSPLPQFIHQSRPGDANVDWKPLLLDLFKVFRPFGPLVSLKLSNIGYGNESPVLRFWYKDSAIAASRIRNMLTGTANISNVVIQAFDPLSIYCAHLPKVLDRPQLVALFQEYGKVVRADVIQRKDNTNFGFVHFDTETSAYLARKGMHGSIVHGTRLDIGPRTVFLAPPSHGNTNQQAEGEARLREEEQRRAEEQRQKEEDYRAETLRAEKAREEAEKARRAGKPTQGTKEAARAQREERRRARERARLELEEALIEERLAQRQLADTNIMYDTAQEELRNARESVEFVTLWRTEAQAAEKEAIASLAAAQSIKNDAEIAAARARRVRNRAGARTSAAQKVWDTLPPEEPDSPPPEEQARDNQEVDDPEQRLQESIRKMRAMQEEEARDRQRKKAKESGAGAGSSSGPNAPQNPSSATNEEYARAREEQERARQEQERALREQARAREEQEKAREEQEKARRELERAREELERVRREQERLENLKAQEEEIRRLRETLLKEQQAREAADKKAQEEREAHERQLREEEQRRQEEAEREKQRQYEEQRRAEEEALRVEAERQEKLRAEAEKEAKEEKEREETRRREAWKEATIQETMRCLERENIRWPRRAKGKWSAAAALSRYNAISDEFDGINFSEQQPLTFWSVPWPVFYPPYDLTMAQIEWSSVEAFFRVVQPIMLPQDYRALVEKSHRRFHPDKWRRRFNSVQDDELRETLERMVISVSQALTPIWVESKHTIGQFC